ncbi:Hypothetical predicted protein [Octopus vulgaris]|uniref:Uncharacterized protein n=1 Tax=Octopus vulgaris TaxID=6645 RepID=A0AA36B995_OCTVU|nr:Hypothetical predicted protein [Octopus vulgaris]
MLPLISSKRPSPLASYVTHEPVFIITFEQGRSAASPCWSGICRLVQGICPLSMQSSRTQLSLKYSKPCCNLLSDELFYCPVFFINGGLKTFHFSFLSSFLNLFLLLCQFSFLILSLSFSYCTLHTFAYVCVCACEGTWPTDKSPTITRPWFQFPNQKCTVFLSKTISHCSNPLNSKC